MYYRDKAHVRPVVSQRKDTEFDVMMESFNLNLPSALITGASRITQSRSMGDFRSLSEDKKMVCTHLCHNIINVEVNLIKVFQNKRLSLIMLKLGTRLVQVD